MNSYVLDGVIDTIAGTCAGVMQVLIGHPLDTIKVRMQTRGAVLRETSISAGISQGFNSTKGTFYGTLKSEGVFGLYKGAMSPMLGAMATNAMCFLSWGVARKIVIESESKHDFGNLFAAGLLSGSITLLVENPVDLVKIQMQVQVGSAQGKYAGVVDCARQIFNQRGIVGFYQGVQANALRFVPGRAIYLSSFDFALHSLTADAKPHIYQCFLAGAFAGGCAWTSTYPMDVVRNRLMGDHTDPTKRKYRGMLHCVQSIVRHEGAHVLWRGFMPCIIRAVPVNGAVFTVYTVLSGTLTDFATGNELM